MIDIELLERAMQRRVASMPSRLRPFTEEYGPLPAALLMIGPRGVGKSTFLLHHSRGRKMLYVSLDNPILATTSLYELVSEIFMRGYEGVILDEVHFARDWSSHVKSLYDDFPGYYLWASDSSSLVLREGTGDLSRRFVPITMPMMSLREYIYLQTGVLYPKYTLGGKLPVNPDANILTLFREYRQRGTRPFYVDGDYEKRYLGIIDKILYNDIPFFLPSINDNNLRLMSAIVGTLAQASIPRIQVKSLCADWGIGAERLYQLLFVMEKVELLRIIRMENDTKSRSVGSKMFFADPCAYHVLHADEGTEREAFVAFCLTQAGYRVNAVKDEKMGDFVITPDVPMGEDSRPITIDVGGERKKPKAADYVMRDNTDYPASGAIPFWLLAMMW